MNLSAISPAAQIAIVKGVERDDWLAELEYLGLSARTIGLLERSPYEIVTLSGLIRRSHDELVEINGLTERALQEIMDCLSRYHELSSMKSLVVRPDASERRTPAGHGPAKQGSATGSAT